jgi:hypothetical protein
VDCHTGVTRFPPALFVPRFRPVGTLLTHGNGGIPSLYQDGFLNRWNDTLATDLEDIPREMGERVLGEEWDPGKHVAKE